MWFVVVVTTFVLGFCMGMCIVGRRELMSVEDVPTSSNEIDEKRQCSQTFRVQGTPKTVMDVLTSFSRYPEWIGDVRECTVYTRSENEYRVRILTPILWFTVATHLVHTITENSMSWCLDADHPNMFSVNNGRWHVRDAEDGTCMVTYTVHLEPTFPLPAHAIDLLQHEASRRAVVWLPQALHTVIDVDVPQSSWYMKCLMCVPVKKNV